MATLQQRRNWFTRVLLQYARCHACCRRGFTTVTQAIDDRHQDSVRQRADDMPISGFHLPGHYGCRDTPVQTPMLI